MTKQDEAIEALNHLDGLADIATETQEEKSEQQKSYNFLWNYIVNSKE